jgi:hypothetical protein
VCVARVVITAEVEFGRRKINLEEEHDTYFSSIDAAQNFLDAISDDYEKHLVYRTVYSEETLQDALDRIGSAVSELSDGSWRTGSHIPDFKEPRDNI